MTLLLSYETSGLRPASASVCFRIWALLKIILSMKNLIYNNIMLAIEIKIQVTNSMILITSTSVSSLLPIYVNFHCLC